MSKISLNRLRVEEWPAQDRALWMRAQQRFDMFDEQGFAVDWRPTTVTNVEKGYGAYLGWLADTGQLAAEEAPLERVTMSRIKAFWSMYRHGRAELSTAGMIRDIAYMLRACHPPHGNERLTKLAHRMVNSARPARPKPPRMATLTELLELGHQLMDEGKILLTVDRQVGAWLFRDGLMISALVAHPLRCRNIAALRLGETIHIEEDVVSVRFDRNETKARNIICFNYPEWLTQHFVFYLNQVRPRLQARSGDSLTSYLWIGRRGRPMSETDVSTAVGRRTQKRLGRRISPHLFRDCVATGIATIAPQDVGITSTILDHATLASSQKYYNQANGFAARDRYQSVLEGFRQKAKSEHYVKKFSEL